MVAQISTSMWKPCRARVSLLFMILVRFCLLIWFRGFNWIVWRHFCHKFNRLSPFIFGTQFEYYTFYRLRQSDLIFQCQRKEERKNGRPFSVWIFSFVPFSLKVTIVWYILASSFEFNALKCHGTKQKNVPICKNRLGIAKTCKKFIVCVRIPPNWMNSL